MKFRGICLILVALSGALPFHMVSSVPAQAQRFVSEEELVDRLQRKISRGNEEGEIRPRRKNRERRGDQELRTSTRNIESKGFRAPDRESRGERSRAPERELNVERRQVQEPRIVERRAPNRKTKTDVQRRRAPEVASRNKTFRAPEPKQHSRNLEMRIPDKNAALGNKRRAPEPRIVEKRAPSSGKLNSRTPGKVQTIRTPESQGGNAVARSRAPGNRQIGRVPAGENGIAFSRAPGASNSQSASLAASLESRSIKPAGEAPTGLNSISKRRKTGTATVVASVGVENSDVEVRGLSVEQNGEETSGNNPDNENYPANGSVDLEILFDYNSDEIDPKSVRQLIALGDALNGGELGSSQFVVAGHTDAVGDESYNDDLSSRRAQAVTDFLVKYAGVANDRLTPEGYGESLLKYPDAPESGQNRRVEIINMGEIQ